MPALTNAMVAAAKPQAKRYEMVDGEGLALVVMPSGAKIWRLRYRVKATGERKRIVLGKFPDLSLSKARGEAAGRRGDVQRGRDPAAEQEAARAAMRMVDLFGETGPLDEKKRLPKHDKSPGWYLGTYCKTAGKLGTSKAASVIESDRYRITKHLRSRSRLMSKPVAAVTPADLDKIKADLSPGSWRKLRAILRIAFAHAMDLGVITSNPTDKVKAIADRKMERFLSPKERAALNAALDAAEKAGPHVEDGLSASLVRLFRLLSLTAMRLGEGLGARWERVDWTHRTIRVMSKTGEKSVPLTDQALAFLKAEHDAAKAELDVGKPVGLVCPDRNGGPLAPNNVQRAWRMLRANAELDDLRLHDLRHSWASDAVSAGVPLYVVGAVLGHRQPSTTARYAHLHDSALREGLARAGAAIEAAASSVTTSRPARNGRGKRRSP